MSYGRAATRYTAVAEGRLAALRPSTIPGKDIFRHDVLSSMVDDRIDEALRETRRAARELVKATAHLSKRLIGRAERAARDPTAAAAKVGRRVAKELDEASRAIERILKHL